MCADQPVRYCSLVGAWLRALVHLSGFLPSDWLLWLYVLAWVGSHEGRLLATGLGTNLLTYDVIVYDICIERPICYLRIAWDRFLIFNKELFCSVLFCSAINWVKI